MDLVRNSSCGLCDENTSVLTKKEAQTFFTPVGEVFFKADNRFQRFQDKLFATAVCALCVRKILTCTQFRNEIKNQKSKFRRKKSCFLCKNIELNLIRTSDNPNGIIAKLTLFKSYSFNNIPYEDCVICLNCLFNIDLWYETRSNLIKKLNIDNKLLKSFQNTSHVEDYSDNDCLKKDKENVTPPNNNIQATSKRLRTANIERNVRNGPKSNTALNKLKRRGKEINRLSNLTNFLNKRLKNMKCLRGGSLNYLNWPAAVSSDRKMFMEIPYVLISSNDFENKSNLRGRCSMRLKSNPVIYVSDSSDEFKKPTRVSFQLPPTEILPSTRNKIPNKCTCSICDQTFSSLCDYKLHCLWHEKPEQCQIDILRQKLPNHIQASEFVNALNKSNKNIEDLIKKYIIKPDSQDLNSTADKIVQSEKLDTSTELNSVYSSDAEDNHDQNRKRSTSTSSLSDDDNMIQPKKVNKKVNANSCEKVENAIRELGGEECSHIDTSKTSDVDNNVSSDRENFHIEKETNSFEEQLNNEKETENFEEKSDIEKENESFQNDEHDSEKENESFHSDEHDCEKDNESFYTNEHDVEKALALLHKDGSYSDEDCNDKNLDKEKEQNSDEDDDCPSSDAEDNRKRSTGSLSDDDNMIKPKKVRFSIDCSSSKSVDDASTVQIDENNLSNNDEHTSDLVEIDN